MNQQENISEYLKNWNKLDRYSQWHYHLYRDYIGKRCLDIGGGIGTAISYYIDKVDSVLATELFDNDVAIMKERFSTIPYFVSIRFDIMKDDIKLLCDYKPDTVICINCLEHIEDDVRALSIMGKIVSEEGYIVICVPAGRNLYCYMDKNVGHYRRYAYGELKEKATQAGMLVVDNFYMNMIGIIPYWLKGKFGKHKNVSFSSSISEGESKLYSFATMFLEPIERLIRACEKKSVN